MPVQIGSDQGGGVTVPDYYAQALQRNASLYAQTAGDAVRANAQNIATGAESAAQWNATDQRAREATLATVPNARDAFHAGVQYNLQAQQTQGQLQEIAARGQVQMALQDQELSQAEKMRMQRLQTAKSYVADAVQTGSLTAEEGNAYLQQIQTGLNPLEARAKAQQVKIQQQQMEAAQQQGQMMAALQSADMATRTKLFQQRIIQLPDPTTGEMNHFFLDHKGDLQPVPHAEARGKQAADTTEKDLDKYEENLRLRYRQARKAIEDRVSAQIMHHDKLRAKPETAGAADKGFVWENEAQMIADRLQGQGYGPTEDSYVAAKMAERGRGSRGVPVQAAAGAAAPPPGQPNPARPETLKPFKLDDLGKAAPVQRFQVNQLDKTRAYIAKDRRDLPQPIKEQYIAVVDEIKELLAKYGSVESPDVPPEDRARYRELWATLDKIPHPPPARPVMTGAAMSHGADTWSRVWGR